MAINEKLIELEGQRGIFQILIFLHQNGEMISGRLYNNKPEINISNNITANRALEILLKHDLICKKEMDNNRAIYYCLTVRGSKICKCIRDMEKILDDI